MTFPTELKEASVWNPVTELPSPVDTLFLCLQDEGHALQLSTLVSPTQPASLFVGPRLQGLYPGQLRMWPNTNCKVT